MIIEFFKNKRNPHKFIEVHYDECGHYSAREVMKHENGVINKIGDGKLHRWRKGNLNSLLDDYEQDDDENWLVLVARCTCCGKHGSYVLSDSEREKYEDYMIDTIYHYPRTMFVQQALPKVPAWIRAGAVKMEMCYCPSCR